ncbi:MAG: hypothetical protein P3C09_14385, partial [Gemmatimonadota bacterium]|nr:hypothetical protein [Gemmatimonadota bacterium]
MKSVVALAAGVITFAIAAAGSDRVDPPAPRALSSGARPVVLSPARFIAPPAPVARYRTSLDRLRPSTGVAARRTRTLAPVVLNDVVKKNCAGCHSDQRKMGNFSLQSFDLATVGATSPIIAEKMIGKLRTGMMPPPGRPRP